MMRVEPLRPHHLERLRLQPRQAYLAVELSGELAADLAEHGPAFAALAGDRVIGAGGALVQGWPMPAVWALLSDESGRWLVSVSRAVLRFLTGLRRPVQTGIEPGHVEGERWARLLGFAPVGPWTDWQSAHGRTFQRWVRHPGANHAAGG